MRGYDSDDDDEMIASALAAVETLRTKKTREEEQASTGKCSELLQKKATPMIIDVEPKEEIMDEADANGEMESCGEGVCNPRLEIDFFGRFFKCFLFQRFLD